MADIGNGDRDRRRAAGRQRAPGQRRRGVPADGDRARGPPRPAARRRDRAPLRLDRVAVPGAELAAGVRGVPARRRPAPRPAAPARPGRRVGRHAPLRRPRLRPGRPLVVPHVRPSQARRADRRPTAASRCRCPRPLAPIAAFVAPEDQAARRADLRGAHDARAGRRSSRPIPHDQLAIQWDTNFEFAMLDGVMGTWFPDPRVEHRRAPRAAGPQHPRRRAARLPLLPRPRAPPPRAPLRRPARSSRSPTPCRSAWDARSTGSTCPSQEGRVDVRFFETLGGLARRPETQLYLGLLHPSDGVAGAEARIVAAQRFVPRLRRGHRLRLGSPPGPGRGRAGRAAPGRHRRPRRRPRPARQPFEWPAGWSRIPDDDWTREPVDAFGASYDSVDRHGWYRNLDPDRGGAGRTCWSTATCCSTTPAAPASSSTG